MRYTQKTKDAKYFIQFSILLAPQKIRASWIKQRKKPSSCIMFSKESITQTCK